jgi:hypothetical protein
MCPVGKKKKSLRVPSKPIWVICEIYYLGMGYHLHQNLNPVPLWYFFYTSRWRYTSIIFVIINSKLIFILVNLLLILICLRGVFWIFVPKITIRVPKWVPSFEILWWLYGNQYHALRRKFLWLWKAITLWLLLYGLLSRGQPICLCDFV